MPLRCICISHLHFQPMWSRIKVRTTSKNNWNIILFPFCKWVYWIKSTLLISCGLTVKSRRIFEIKLYFRIQFQRVYLETSKSTIWGKIRPKIAKQWTTFCKSVDLDKRRRCRCLLQNWGSVNRRKIQRYIRTSHVTKS